MQEVFVPILYRYNVCKCRIYPVLFIDQQYRTGKITFLVYILPSAVQAYFIILVKTYIESIPGELIESAEIDGAGLVKNLLQAYYSTCKADSGMYYCVCSCKSVECMGR